MKQNYEFSFNQDIFDKTVSKYKMDETEKTSYKISFIWYEKSRKYFPNLNQGRIKKGDPRKSWIFKICYKLVRETAGLLDPENYELYVRAQLEILYLLSKKNFVTVDASILVGEKAWRRWRIWKSRYDTVMNKPSEVSFVVSPGRAKAIKGLQDTYDFFKNRLNKIPNLQDLKNFHASNDLFLWVNFGKVSPYYLALSPYCNNIMTKENFNRLKFDPEIYKPCIDGEVVQKFKELFVEEGKELI